MASPGRSRRMPHGHVRSADAAVVLQPFSPGKNWLVRSVVHLAAVFGAQLPLFSFSHITVLRSPPGLFPSEPAVLYCASGRGKSPMMPTDVAVSRMTYVSNFSLPGEVPYVDEMCVPAEGGT